MEGTPPGKRDEQFPLLKLDTGGGDTKQTTGGTPVANGGWIITAKKSWMDKCPELLTACWMMLALLGVAMLMLYALGVGSHHKKSLIYLGSNNSKPGRNVFLHRVIPRSTYLPITQYQNFLADLAYEFPLMKIQLLFLLDDTWQSTFRITKHSKMLKKFLHHPALELYNQQNPSNEKQILEFVKKYPNVNITVVPLSYYMSMSPLKHRWRSIPLSYIPFYARITDVWQYGGVGLDLDYFNNIFRSRRCLDRRISLIIKKHNEGIKNGEYAKILNNIEFEEDSENIMLMFYRMINQIIDDSYNFLNTTELKHPDTNQIDSHVRNHRAKRTVLVNNSKTNQSEAHDSPVLLENPSKNKTNEETIVFQNNSNSAEQKTDVNPDEIVIQSMQTSSFEVTVQTTELPQKESVRLVIQLQNNSTPDNSSSEREVPIISSNNTRNLNYTERNTDKPSRLFVFYDLILPGNSILESETLPGSKLQHLKREPVFNKNKVTENVPDLTIDSEGLFVAASMRSHPFLSLLLTSTIHMHPKYAIENAYFTQCSYPFMRDDTYCNHIFLL